MSGKETRTPWTLLLIPVLVVLQATMLLTYDAQKAVKMPSSMAPPPLLGGALLGFRTVMADLMWLESDRYFHDGRYELAWGSLQLAALMDPKFVQAWALGGWHMIYQFKMVPEGFQFLRQGIDENPNDYRLYFEMSFHYFFKLEEYSLALAYARDAARYPNRDLREPHPSYVERLLAHSYDAVGGTENWNEAVEVWAKVQKMEPDDTVPRDHTRKIMRKIEAEALEQAGELQKALELWDKILEEHPIDRIGKVKTEELRLKLGLPIRPPREEEPLELPFATP